MPVNIVKIQWQDLFRRIDGLKTDAQNRISIDREIIPIVFVPGIMGSRLRRNKGQGKIWDPDSKMFMISKFGWITVTAAERKDLVIGQYFSLDHAAVHDRDAKHNKKFASQQDTTREKRGWGGVMWGSYGDFLVKLQQHKWPSPLNACFEFPVHAFGYNWTASNDDSGVALQQYIHETISDYKNGVYSPDGSKRKCKKVILVTHSMGGLVARSACMLHGAGDEVLGVVHGVQPAAGSPAAYWRMKAGFERPRGGPRKEWWDWLRNPLKMAKHQIVGHTSAVVLGTDGEEVTSLLGNSPGGLELLPTARYCDGARNRQWLLYPSAHGEVKLPNADPYEDVYLLQNRVYRMVDPVWLNSKYGLDTVDKDQPASGDSWDQYSTYLRQAKNFHERLGLEFFPESYQFYGTDLDSPDRIDYSRQPWSAPMGNTDLNMRFTNKGGFKAYVNNEDCPVSDGKEAVAIVALEAPSGKGDGTVPEFSGGILPLPKERTTKIGTEEGSWFEIGHQDILGTRHAQEIVFTCIWNLAQKYIDDHFDSVRASNKDTEEV